MQTAHPLTKILLPYDGSPSAGAAARYAISLAKGVSIPGQEITLLHVTGGSYLARHLQNVDLRVTRLEKTSEWRRIREHFIEREIRPLLVSGRKPFLEAGLQAAVKIEVQEGQIGEKILEAAAAGRYTAIIMGRRGLSAFQELLLGSVTQYVLTHARGLTVFVVGRGYQEGSLSPLFPMLVPVDGSEPSLAAVSQAARLAQGWQLEPPRLRLLHVVDLALLGQMLTQEAQGLVAEGRQALAAARAILTEAGIQDAVEERLVSGIPAQVIAQEARESGSPLIFMGSKGYSRLSRLILGSVTNSVLHLATEPTIGVVYPPAASGKTP